LIFLRVRFSFLSFFFNFILIIPSARKGVTSHIALSAAVIATRLTTNGYPGQADWSRNKYAPPIAHDFSLFLSIEHQGKGREAKLQVCPKASYAATTVLSLSGTERR
jgi:hypothetical protein